MKNLLEIIETEGRPFFLLRKNAENTIYAATGSVTHMRTLAELQIPAAKGESVPNRICAIPFAQIREKGFEVVDGGEPIACLTVESSIDVSIEDFRSVIRPVKVALDGTERFDVSDDQYSTMVQNIIDNEIERGAGANFVVPREFQGQLVDFSPDTVLNLFLHLLDHEKGAYWTFLFSFDGKYLVGASPERLISSERGVVVKNPISGTFRKGEQEGDEGLRQFLSNEKEIYELFMVVDEELKVMSAICPKGGRVVGPFLKEMSQLVHTEYLLVGESEMTATEQLKHAMFAPTVVGSPLESACRINRKYRPVSRRYYGSAVALLGGAPPNEVLDTAITIRTAEIDAKGRVSIQVGATLVNHSNPDDEVLETHSKVAGLLRAMGFQKQPVAPEMATNSRNLCSPDLETMLASRNSLLSSFWLSDQAAMRIEPSGDRDLLTGKSIMIIDFEDAFTMMLRHLLVSLGAEASIVSWRSVSETDVRCDLVVVGPGPGDPNDNHDLRIQTGRRVTERLLSTKRPFLSVCLGHQILCRALGLKVVKKSSVSQGTQEEIDIFGESRCVGFYNTFVAKWPANGLPGVKASLGKDSYVYALRGDHFASFQFHVESVLTKDGREILARVLRELMQEGASEG